MAEFSFSGNTGWLEGARREESPNVNERPAATDVELAVVHFISLPPNEFGGDDVANLFLNRIDLDAHPFFGQLKDLRVSTHFFIRRTGEVIQFADCDRRAWHAGLSSWHGREGCNDFSVGIELEGSAFVPFTSGQYDALADVLKALCARYPIKEIAGHEHIAPARKTDPGAFFDWERLGKLLKQKAVSTADGKTPAFYFG